MIGLSTETFRDSLHQLCRKPKHKYGSCPSDICDELKDKTVEDLAETNVRLNDNGVRCVLKMRVANAGRGIGQSSGYRVIAVGDREKQEVVFLYVYPKTGALGVSDITDKHLGELLTAYFAERDNGLLVRLDLENKLIEVAEK